LIEKHMPPIKAGSMHLDLDDVESATHMRIAGLYRINGDTLSAAREEREARESALQEQDALNRFDRVYVCTPADRELLAGRGPAEVRILPNTIRCSSRSQTAPDIPFTFLLLGTLGYFPNQDAARYFCAQVLPLIRDMAPADVRVTIAGSGAGRQLKELDRVRGVTVAGEVSQVEGLYRSASAVVVPVRAGGGTRIKILEAFCHGRPVVSTSMGMEGIEARDWEHALIADDPEVFAQRCVQLMHDPDLIERMTRNARELVSREYSPEVAARSVAR
ncbi:MAG: glycosyltransferase family 4 protein, partial [Chloroflexota bacterium]